MVYPGWKMAMVLPSGSLNQAERPMPAVVTTWSMVLNVPVSSNDPERLLTTRFTPLKFSPAALGAAEAAPDGAADVAALGLELELPQAARNAAARGAVAPALRSCRRLTVRRDSASALASRSPT